MPSADALRAGEATIELSLIESQFDKQLQAVKSHISRAFSGMTSKLGQAPGLSSAIEHGNILTRTWTRFKGIFGSLPQQAGRFRNALSAIGQIKFDNILSLRALFAGAGITVAVAFPIKLAANLELATAQMSVFTGSLASARKLLLELLEFSSVAMQSPEELANQARLLMTRGIKPDMAIKDIEAIAVLAAGSREEFEELSKAFADVANKGSLAGEEMRQFKNTAFNPLNEIAKATGETMAQLEIRLKAGGISFEEVAAALHASVRAGGLFHGMLTKISDTLIGKFSRAFAVLKIAILPIGEALLTPLKTILDRLILAAPGLQELIAKNKALVVTLAGAIVQAAATATLFLAISVAATVLSIVIGGLAATFASLFAIIAFLITPLGWLVVALGVVLYKTLITSGALKEFATQAMEAFGILGRTIAMAFQGITAALSAKDFSTAMAIATQAMNVLWLQMTGWLRYGWAAFELWFLDSLGKMVDEAAVRINQFLQFIQDKMPLIARLFGINVFTQMNVIGIGAQIKNTLRAAAATVEGNSAEANARLRAEEAKLKKMVDDAEEEAKQHGGIKDFFGDKNPFSFAHVNSLAGMKGGPPIATFDTALARQMFGRSSEIDTLKKIEKNTRPRHGRIKVTP